MQERTSLEDALEGIGKVERELTDNVEMIELGEAENDADVVTEAENALKALKKEVARRELEALLSGEASISSALSPRSAAQRWYMRSSISAQSCASVPPSPAWISHTASCSS